MRTHRTPPRTLSSLLVLGAIALAPASPALAQPGPLPAPPAPNAAPAVTGDFDTLVAQAQKLVTEERHSEALRLWHAAYTQRQRPELLVHIARAEQRLGLADAALDAYKRYLTAEPNPPPELRTEAEQAIARLSRMSTTAPAVGVPPGPMAMANPGMPMAIDEEGRAVPLQMVTRKYHNGMRTAGIVLASVGYGISFVVGLTMGSILVGGSSSRSSDYRFGQGAFTLLVPVAGPIISSIVVPTIYREDATYYWSLPISFTLGAMEIIGVGLWAGAYRNPQKRLIPLVNDLRIVPNLAPGYAGVSGGFSF